MSLNPLLSAGRGRINYASASGTSSSSSDSEGCDSSRSGGGGGRSDRRSRENSWIRSIYRTRRRESANCAAGCEWWVVLSAIVCYLMIIIILVGCAIAPSLYIATSGYGAVYSANPSAKEHEMVDREALFQMEERTTNGNGRYISSGAAASGASSTTFVGNAIVSTAFAVDSCSSLIPGNCDNKWASSENIGSLLPKYLPRNAVINGLSCNAVCTGSNDNWYGYGRCICSTVPSKFS